MIKKKLIEVALPLGTLSLCLRNQRLHRNAMSAVFVSSTVV